MLLTHKTEPEFAPFFDFDRLDDGLTGLQDLCYRSHAISIDKGLVNRYKFMPDGSEFPDQSYLSS